MTAPTPEERATAIRVEDIYADELDGYEIAERSKKIRAEISCAIRAALGEARGAAAESLKLIEPWARTTPTSLEERGAMLLDLNAAANKLRVLAEGKPW